ncbi:MAG: TlpA disulfide reductase family protein [Candidatus Acidiferrales bacterium]|jgi:peroxiredoxin
MTKITAGKPAPKFTLTSTSGEKYSLAEALKRGPVVLAFFKVSCPVCQFTFPFLERLHEKYGAEGVMFWGISQDNARDTKDFCAEYGVTFPVFLDERGYPVSNDYGLTNVPTVFLVEPGGKAKISCVGFDKADLEAIAKELAGRRQIPLEPLFRRDEVIPAYKPG